MPPLCFRLDDIVVISFLARQRIEFNTLVLPHLLDRVVYNSQLL